MRREQMSHSTKWNSWWNREAFLGWILSGPVFTSIKTAPFRAPRPRHHVLHDHRALSPIPSPCFAVFITTFPPKSNSNLLFLYHTLSLDPWSTQFILYIYIISSIVVMTWLLTPYWNPAALQSTTRVANSRCPDSSTTSYLTQRMYIILNTPRQGRTSISGRGTRHRFPRAHQQSPQWIPAPLM